MPTYEYQCRTCEARFDVVQSFVDAALAVCPSVGEAASPAACVSPGEGVVKKVFSAPAITFKGDGFYKTDSRKAASKEGKGSGGTGGDSSVSSDSGGDSASGSAVGKEAEKSDKDSSDSAKTPVSV